MYPVCVNHETGVSKPSPAAASPHPRTHPHPRLVSHERTPTESRPTPTIGTTKTSIQPPKVKTGHQPAKRRPSVLYGVLAYTPTQPDELSELPTTLSVP